MDTEGVGASFNSNSLVIKEMDGKIDVFYALPSPFCRSVLMLARALDIKLNLKEINLLAGEHMTPDFLKINPQHCIPTMVEDDYILWESRAIMQYLVDRFDQNKKYRSEDPKENGMINQRLYFDATTLSPKLVEYYYPVLLGGKPDDTKLVKYGEALGLLDGFLEKSLYVAGDKITIADFCVAVNLATAEAVGVDISPYPKVFALYENLKKELGPYGYEEINQEGANILGQLFKENAK